MVNSNYLILSLWLYHTVRPDEVKGEDKLKNPRLLGSTLASCQSTTLHIKLCAFLTHLQCISKALPCTLMHFVSDSSCYATPHHPLHLCHCMWHLCLFVCLFTFVTSAHVACFVCLFPLPDWFH